jgi:2-iminobutanoate/2-iminopropanoate deaminase
MKEAVVTDRAPAAIGPYSQAVRAGDLVFVSGQLPVDPATGAMPQGVREQTRRVLENIGAVLEAAGLGFADVVKTTVFMTDLKGFAEMNEEYARAFTAPAPARATVEVRALPKAALVQIEAVARVPGK